LSVISRFSPSAQSSSLEHSSVHNDVVSVVACCAGLMQIRDGHSSASEFMEKFVGN
jgi:hypothetical protein